MGMTKLGIIKQQYSEIEPKPFSRFTQVQSEIDANKQWEQRAIEWGNLKSQQQENEGGVVTMIVKTDDEVPTNIVRTEYPNGRTSWSKVTPTKENDRV